MTDNPYADNNPYASNSPLTPDMEKTWAILQNVAAIFFEGLAPLIAFLVFNGRGPFITHHVKESLNFGITMVITAVVLVVSIVGWLVIWALPIYYVIFRIIAAYKASLGEYYKFPLTFRFIK